MRSRLQLSFCQGILIVSLLGILEQEEARSLGGSYLSSSMNKVAEFWKKLMPRFLVGERVKIVNLSLYTTAGHKKTNYDAYLSLFIGRRGKILEAYYQFPDPKYFIRLDHRPKSYLADAFTCVASDLVLIRQRSPKKSC